MFFPTVKPEQLYGIEINEYAHELAQATIWIGYIQWLRENGFGQPSEPILKALDNIHEMDAILAFDEDGNLVEPEWPEADVAIGNPPFLGGSKLRRELGDEYVEKLFTLFGKRIPGTSDLCCYWFEKARAMVESGALKRAGLLATQGIRGGASRTVLERIKKSGDIFWAQSDRNWVLEGAIVHVSMVGFDDGAERHHNLDDLVVQEIHSDLSSHGGLTNVQRLRENKSVVFRGDTKGGPFEITGDLASSMLAEPLNPNGRPNRDVVRRWMNAKDVTGEPRGMWIIDFGTSMPEAVASQYEPTIRIRPRAR